MFGAFGFISMNDRESIEDFALIVQHFEVVHNFRNLLHMYSIKVSSKSHRHRSGNDYKKKTYLFPQFVWSLVYFQYCWL